MPQTSDSVRETLGVAVRDLVTGHGGITQRLKDTWSGGLVSAGPYFPWPDLEGKFRVLSKQFVFDPATQRYAFESLPLDDQSQIAADIFNLYIEVKERAGHQ
ncbi:MAG TPA: hypothetical protein VMA37_14165 [Acetobacteraceae bacterium]|nr:hypothetical protein [Acetobacteraceae bacterium]